MKQRMHLISLAFLLLACPGVSEASDQARSSSATEPVRREGAHLKYFNEMNKRLDQGNVDLLFIGDSITASWLGRGKEVWDEYYAHRQAVNLGRSGERTQHVLWQLDHLHVARVAPKLAVVLIGTNNLRTNSAEEIADGVTRIVRGLRAILSKTRILLMAVLPRGPNNDDPERQIVEQVNRIIAKVADGEDVIFMDLRDRFLKPDGTPTSLLRSDLVHITPEGYRVWAKAIEPVVSKTLDPLPNAKSKRGSGGSR